MSEPEKKNEKKIESITESISGILTELGEDVSREGLQKTPKHYAKAMNFLTSGYEMKLGDVVGDALFKAEANDIVLIRDIEFFSMCEHHLLPFAGKAHVAYIPQKHVIGLSKVPRIVDVYARRLQLQERLTSQIAHAIKEVLDPIGVAVVINAAHFCMMMRGVQKQDSKTVSSTMLGAFRDDAVTRKELLHLLGPLS